MLSRRSFLVSVTAATAAAALAACGDADPAPAGNAAPAGGDGFPRDVDHELGTTEVQAAPQRVVCATDGGELCSLLALGVTPVGFGQRNDPLRPWVRDLAAGVDTYPLDAETDFERLAVWQPDLLLVQEGFATEDTYPDYTALAPTIATSFIDWRANLRQVGDAVGRPEEAAALEQQKDDAVAALAAALPAGARGLRVNAMATFGDGTVYVLNADSPAGKIAEALGLAPLPPADTAGEAVNLVSTELLSVVDGDLLLRLHFGADDDGTDQLATTGVYQALGVVQAGAVVDLTEDESQQLYFDSVLTVEPNAELLSRLATDTAG
ncbi:ABC transporter substrate-binding protein [Modestobacter sp. I12A-02628]|uniref:ABC transporter substrate-binding protein n=1 Tax=Goekera deserti TaxID=2497753 RepID=A0A7K3WKH0_9ACTN|nr:ABC transporter substrate-binding protein [Goekera deserti]MPQ97080.1 ABC transporter substrate-binding protein [Goekera deserti]NDI46603.1 ABC transporter substrate-binding protein [Goekera deserti]NEL56359.1 ABC transporter substrate-binding protein [Goekera deserti]